jgi:hypothetical protein
MNRSSETTVAAPEIPAGDQKIEIEAKASGRKTTRAPSPAELRARTALIKALASNIGAIIMAVGLVIVLGIAVFKESKDAYAPICALLGTLVGTWLRGKPDKE